MQYISSSDPLTPVRTLAVGTCSLTLEGALHDGSRSHEEEVMRALLSRFASRDDLVPTLLRLLRDDFEGILLFQDTATRRMILVNDLLGRLPLYYTEGRPHLFSRTLGAVLQATPARPDPLGAAQYLTLRYCLGGRTPFAGVRVVQAATMITSEPGKQPSFRELARLDFDDEARSGRPLEDNAVELANLLTTACMVRAGAANVVSVSGGLDSRSVVAALQRGGVAFDLVSFNDRQDGPSADVLVGRQIAKIVGCAYDVVQTRPPNMPETDRLLSLTDGQNIAEMGFILPLLDRIVALYGPDAIVFTGDGGDRTMPVLSMGRTPGSDRELARFFLNGRDALAPHRAAQIAGITTQELEDSVIEAIESLRVGARHKYAAFTVYERGRHLLFGGEERNRHFCHHAAPFFAVPFITAAFTVPDRQKANYKLYRAFLRALSPTLAELPYANYGSAVTSVRFRAEQGLRTAARAVNAGSLRARILPPPTKNSELDPFLPTLQMGAPGLDLGEFLDDPQDDIRSAWAPWAVYALCWMYNRFVQ